MCTAWSAIAATVRVIATVALVFLQFPTAWWNRITKTMALCRPWNCLRLLTSCALEVGCLLGCCALSVLEVYRRFSGVSCLHIQGYVKPMFEESVWDMGTKWGGYKFARGLHLRAQSCHVRLRSTRIFNFCALKVMCFRTGIHHLNRLSRQCATLWV
jgi:hypothetical protein